MLNDRLFNILKYQYLHLKRGSRPRWLNFSRPRTFNEHILKLKLDGNASWIKPLYVDKIAVRDFVAERVGSEFLIPLLGVFEDALSIDWDALPQAFVIKANHGSGFNLICKDKAKLDKANAREIARSWLETDYARVSREWAYKGVLPRLLVEEYLHAEDGGDLKDFKIFCFGGIPKFIQVDVDRFSRHRRAYYDLNWRRLPFSILHPHYEGEVPRPASLSTMIELAEKLSAGMQFVRVDLYEHVGRPFFGELTFFHGGGFEPFFPSHYEVLLGQLFESAAPCVWDLRPSRH